MLAQKIGGASQTHDVRNAVTDGYFPLHHSGTHSCLSSFFSPSSESLVRGYNATVKKKNDGIKDEGVREEGRGRRKNEGQNKGRKIYEGPTTFICVKHVI